MYLSSFFFYVTATTEIYTYGHTLSLPDALPIWLPLRHREPALRLLVAHHAAARLRLRHGQPRAGAAQGAGGAERPRSGRLCLAPHPGARPCRRGGSGLPGLSQDDAARRLSALAALRLPNGRATGRERRWSTW